MGPFAGTRRFLSAIVDGAFHVTITLLNFEILSSKNWMELKAQSYQPIANQFLQNKIVPVNWSVRSLVHCEEELEWALRQQQQWESPLTRHSSTSSTNYRSALIGRGERDTQSMACIVLCTAHNRARCCLSHGIRQSRVQHQALRNWFDLNFKFRGWQM